LPPASSARACCSPAFQIAVGLPPGSITTTFTPKGASSSRSESLKASSANLLAWYAPVTGNAIRPPMLETLMMVPRAALSSGNSVWVTATCATTLTSSCARKSASGRSSSGPG